MNAQLSFFPAELKPAKKGNPYRDMNGKSEPPPNELARMYGEVLRMYREVLNWYNNSLEERDRLRTENLELIKKNLELTNQIESINIPTRKNTPRDPRCRMVVVKR